MKILITGGTGTISSGLVKECTRREGYEVYAITRGNKKTRNVDGAKYIYADVWNTEDVRQKTEGLYFDVVVECLAYDLEQLKISLKNFGDKCEQYIFISTSAVYTQKGEIPIKENDEKNHVEWSYAKKKIECEEYLTQYSGAKFKYTIIRPFVTYGDYRVPFPVVSRKNQWTIFERIINDVPIVACKDNNIRHSVIHIDDFSRAVVSLFGNNVAFDNDYNVASLKQVISWDETIRISEEILNVKSKIIHIPLEIFRKCFIGIYDELSLNKAEPLIADDKKIKNAVPDFDIKVNLKEGMSRTIKNLKKENDTIKPEYDEYFNFSCDKVIYYAYVNEMLDNAERSYAKDYIAKWDKRKRRDVQKSIKKDELKYFIEKNKILNHLFTLIKKSR